MDYNKEVDQAYANCRLYLAKVYDLETHNMLARAAFIKAMALVQQSKIIAFDALGLEPRA